MFNKQAEKIGSGKGSGFSSSMASDCMSELSQRVDQNIVFKKIDGVSICNESGVICEGPRMGLFNSENDSLVAVFVSEDGNRRYTDAFLFSTAAVHSMAIDMNYKKMTNALQAIAELSDDAQITALALNALIDELYLFP
jgi:hypothetical protein